MVVWALFLLTNKENQLDLKVYTDGSCVSNPGGPGGWAWAMFDEEGEKLASESGSEKKSTNNRAELLAVIQAMKYCNQYNYHNAVIISDSRYVIGTLNNSAERLKRWLKDGFKGKKNVDLWHSAIKEFPWNFQFEWVKGHSGNKFNDLVDYMAGLESGIYSPPKKKPVFKKSVNFA